MKRFIIITVTILFILTTLNVSSAYGFELGGDHGGEYDLEAYWPTQSNLTRLSQSPSLKDPVLKWSYSIMEEIVGSSVIGRDGTVYFYTSSDYLYAMNPNNTLKWKVPCGNTTYNVPSLKGGSPILGRDNLIYVASDEGVIAFNTTNGLRKWTHTLYKGDIVNYMALDSNGDILVSYISTDYPLVGPISYYDFYLTCLDKVTGSLKWEKKENVFNDSDENAWDIDYACSPAVDKDGNIYAVVGKTLYALNSEGNTLWYKDGFNHKFSRESLILLYNNLIYFADNDIEGDLGSPMYCYNKNGDVQFSISSIHGQCVPGPDGSIYAVKGVRDNTNPYFDSGLYKIGYNGFDYDAQIYHYIAGFFNSPTITSDNIMYLDKGMAINLNTKRVIWDLGDVGENLPAIGKDGMIYYISENSHVLKTFVENQTLNITQNNFVINEGENSLDIRVNRSGSIGNPVSFTLQTDIPHTKGGTDYINRDITFNAYESYKIVTIDLPEYVYVNDDVYLGDKEYNISISNDGNYLLGLGQAKMKVIDDDRVAGCVEFQQNAYSVQEEDGLIIIPVNRVNGSDGEITIDYSTGDDTALGGTDYVSTSGTLTLNNGETQKDICISIIDDDVYRKDRHFTLQLANPQLGTALGDIISTDITIMQNDPIDNDGPVFQSINNSDCIGLGDNIEILFDEIIEASSNFSQIKVLKDDVQIDCSLAVDGNKLVINPIPNLEYSTLYKVIIPSGSIQDRSENALENEYISSFTSEDSIFAGGTGTAENPYLVATAEQFDAIRFERYSYYKLINDIDISSLGSFEPICNDSAGFVGVFDGNGCVISGIHINKENSKFVGLFGRNKGTILNLGIENGTIYTTSNSGQYYLGGIVGYNDGFIFNSYNSCDIKHSTTINIYNYFTGGIAGYNTGSIESSYNTGKIISDFGRYSTRSGLGGVVGINTGSINKCYNTDNLDSIFYYCPSTYVKSFYEEHSTYEGGIAGINDGSITNSYNTQNLLTYSKCGPIAGLNSGHIHSCYSMGKGNSSNTASSKWCGVVYKMTGGSIENCYFIDPINKTYYERTNGTINNSINKTDSELKQESAFVGFDFDTVWSIDEGNDYPKLLLPIPPTEVVLNTNNITLKLGETYSLNAEIIPENTTVDTLIWSSTNNDIISILDGNITTNNCGNTIVYASALDGAITASCSITVIGIQSIEITHLPNKLTYYAGEALDITGLEVTGTYADGTMEVLSISNDNISGFDSSLPIDSQTLTVNFDYHGDTFTDTFDIAILPKSSKNDSQPQQKIDSTGNIEVYQPSNFDNGTALVNIDERTLIYAFNNANQNEEGLDEISVNLPNVENAEEYKLTFLADFLSSDEKDRVMTIHTEFASITLPSNMLNGDTNNHATNISLEIGEVDKSKLDQGLQDEIGNRPVISLKLNVDDNEDFSWHNSNCSVAVTLPYEPSEEELKDLEHINVWYIDGQGNIITITTGRYNPETKTVTFETNHFSQFAVVYVEKTFDDINNYPWAKKPIEILASKGIINGTTQTTYSPSENITRADYLTLLIKALGLTAEVDSNFADVQETDYYYEAIGIAKKLGITVGSGNNQFNPKEYITRQDMMILTERALSITNKLTTNSVDKSQLEKFEDKELIAPYAKDSIARLIEEGLIKGSNNILNPLGNTTRAEAAVLVYRIYNF